MRKLLFTLPLVLAGCFGPAPLAYDYNGQIVTIAKGNIPLDPAALSGPVAARATEVCQMNGFASLSYLGLKPAGHTFFCSN
ncbi:hypothetical protein BFP70_12460 [Thioclava sp. SK-1]|uniref:hypothetical protein n=1 Tax=Thioclava sp. SK-1 TaxID=1889770 RepID=UPI000858D40C|nr:hypothetical protein [Thioclava sp. SK-1]OCX63034.1 hypothetical protein BFP70_12460 [Thioclava sp. SK-1]